MVWGDMMDKKKLLKKIVFFCNVAVSLWITVPYTLKISFSSISPHFSDWLTPLVLSFFTSLLLGTPMHIVYLVLICFIFKDTSAMDDYDNVALTRSALDAVFLSTFYTILLYYFGLTDTYFCFISIYEW